MIHFKRNEYLSCLKACQIHFNEINILKHYFFLPVNYVGWPKEKEPEGEGF